MVVSHHHFSIEAKGKIDFRCYSLADCECMRIYDNQSSPQKSIKNFFCAAADKLDEQSQSWSLLMVHRYLFRRKVFVFAP